MKQVKRLLLDLLKKGNMTENELNREEFRIPNEKDLRKKCKYLGPLIDTELAINRRKSHTVSKDARAPTKVAHSNHKNKAGLFGSLYLEYFPAQQRIMDHHKKPLKIELIVFNGSCFTKSSV